MRKKIIKICIPILFLAGFLAIVVFSQKEIEEQKFPITPSDFSTFVYSYINDSIVNKNIRDARRAYKNLHAIISTEESLYSTNPSVQLLDPSIAEDCYDSAFAAYFVIFKNDADNLFNNSTWNETHLDTLKSEAEELLRDYKGTSQNTGDLTTYIGWVDGYYKAKNLIEKTSKRCKSKEDYDNLINNANKYIGFPYINNTQLQGIVKKVKDNAENPWWNNINDRVDNMLTRKPKFYKTYDNFLKKYYTPLYNDLQCFGNLYPSYSVRCSDFRNDIRKIQTQTYSYYERYYSIDD